MKIMKYDSAAVLAILLGLSIIPSAMGESFSCRDYFGTTQLDVIYNSILPNSKQIDGTFILQSPALQGQEEKGRFFNYAAVLDQYSLYAASESGEWVSASGGYQLNFGNLHAIVHCSGDVP